MAIKEPGGWNVRSTAGGGGTRGREGLRCACETQRTGGLCTSLLSIASGNRPIHFFPKSLSDY
jgi:hypothetical protein